MSEKTGPPPSYEGYQSANYPEVANNTNSSYGTHKGDEGKTPLLVETTNYPPPPPPNYQYPQQQGGHTTIIVEEKNSGGSGVVGKCCGIMCSVTMIIVCSLFCLCCLAIVVTGIVFAVWAIACVGTYTVGRTDYASHSFSSSGAKSVTLLTNGVLEISPSSNTTFSVFTKAEIRTKNEEDAEDVEFNLERNDQEFFLEYLWSFWSCSSQDIYASLQDLPSTPYPVILKAKNSVNQITLYEFSHLLFDSVDLESSTGKITVLGLQSESKFLSKTSTGMIMLNNINAGMSLEVESSTGSISLSNSSAGSDISVKSSTGSITLSNLSSREFDVSVSTGRITASNITLEVSGNCELEFETSTGGITINSLSLPTSLSSPCDLDISSSTGRIEVHLQNFSGDYEAKSSTGGVYVDGERCSSNCFGNISGPVQHFLSLRSSTGRIDLYFS